MRTPVDPRFTCSCGSRERRDSFEFYDGAFHARYAYHECDGCGLWQMSPQPDDATLAVAYAPAYYGSTRRKFIGPVAALVAAAQRGRARYVLRLLGEANPRILDVGCGNGGFLAAAATLGARCEGTELSDESRARAVSAPGITIHALDLDQLAGMEPGYDAVTMWHVIEHMRTPDVQLALVASMLKPGGLLFVSTPNHESWQAKFFREHWFHLDPPRHLWGFSPRSLGDMVKRHGFTPIALTTHSLEQNPYGIVQSVLNRTGFLHNRAYETLKGSPRPCASRLVDLMSVAGLTLPALIGASVESAFGRGGTFCLVARRDHRVQEQEGRRGDARV